MNILSMEGLDAWESYIGTGSDSAEVASEAYRQQFRRTRPDYQEVSFPPPIFENTFLATVGNVGVQFLELIMSLPERIFEGDYARLLAFQGIYGEEAEFLQTFCTPRFLSMARQFARPDLLISNKGLKAVEINVSPALGGLGLCDRITREFRSTPFAAHLKSRGLSVDAEDMMAFWKNALVASARRFREQEPLVFFEALVTETELENPYSFHNDFLEPIRNFGFQVETGLLQSLRITPNGVFHGNTRIDVVYTMFTYLEIVKLNLPKKLFFDLVAADSDGLIDFVSPPVGVIFDNKANLELLTSPDYASFFSTNERAFVDAHLPSTRRLQVDGYAEAIANRSDFVLKPTSEFGGKSVCVGANVDQFEWERCLAEATASGKQFVLQKRIDDLWLYQSHDGPNVEPCAVCLGPVLLGGRYSGTLVRQAPIGKGTPVINGGKGAAVSTGFGLAQLAKKSDSQSGVPR